MPTSQSPLIECLHRRRVATLPELMDALGTRLERTVFRRLAKLDYHTSYSHRGAYYALDEVALFDSGGLWSCRSAWFSRQGTLLDTAKAWVDASEAGLRVDELDARLHVSTQDALRKLERDRRVTRERHGRAYLYFSADPQVREQQRGHRQAPPADLAAPPPAGGDKMKAAIVLFCSLLDEKQRRLYAGLQSLEAGDGGDRQIADWLGLDVHTVARGRRELLTGDIEHDRVRRVGGGRPAVEKKRLKSSSTSLG